MIDMVEIVTVATAPWLRPRQFRVIFKEKSMGTILTVLGAIGSAISIANFMKSLS
ncbi:hypothetical protein SAMN05444583_10354 [Rhodococcus maanshanensis]|uniref:Uncharacterized protein n=1 Tax=Rhodococcus maanshanensis TaxID=183556 RepID=A0A1H7J111_9NOCA|nr:hypothetical protein SAMN05444583_10354 [Rhodococcus maanshanensis]